MPSPPLPLSSAPLLDAAHGVIWPAVAPYDPTNPANADFLATRLRELRDDDSNRRVNAFNGLRAFPREQVRQGWERSRQQQPPEGFETDCLNRLWIEEPKIPLVGARAFATIISNGYEPMLRALLDSLSLRGECSGVPIIVFCVGDEVYQSLESWPDITRIRCHASERISPAIKGAIYSCARWLGFETIISLEADTLVVGELASIFDRVERAPASHFYGCRSQVRSEQFTLREVLGHMNTPRSDLFWLTQRPNYDALFHFNGGLLAARREAWQALDAAFESLNPFISLWVEGAFHFSFLDEFALNLVLGLSPDLLPTELPPTFNVQIIDADVAHWLTETPTSTGSHFTRFGQVAHVLHFIHDKPLQATLANHLSTTLMSPQVPTATLSPSALPQLPSSGMLRCRQCHVQKSCGSCFEPSTIAVERLTSGARSALCRACFAKRQGLAPDTLPLDVRLELEDT